MANKDKAQAFYEQPIIAAASLRAPKKGEVYPIAITTASQTFTVPAAWAGSLVRVQADGGDVFLQTSDDASAAVDKTAVCTTAGSPIALTPPAAGCFKVFNGQWLDIPFPAVTGSWAAQGSVACTARAHLAET
ncbi:MAG: hypothetical protein H0X39_00430 [Actinobacteria bacterium]|nr:hypothetical protein [Actinomycetota bacterium]